jgi:hypothetical protein
MNSTMQLVLIYAIMLVFIGFGLVPTTGPYQWSEPMIYAIGTGMLGTQLFLDGFEVGGGDGVIFRLFKGLKLFKTGTYSEQTCLVIGTALAVVGLCLGNVQWTGPEDESDNAKYVQPLELNEAVTKYIVVNIGLFVAIALNFLGDIGLAFEASGKIGDIVKIGLDNFILLLCLTLSMLRTSRRYPAKDPKTAVSVAAFCCTLFFLPCIFIKFAMDDMDSPRLEALFLWSVPLVLIYTLLAELAPNAFVLESVEDGEIRYYPSDAPAPSSKPMLANRNVWFWLALLLGIILRVILAVNPLTFRGNDFGEGKDTELQNQIHFAVSDTLEGAEELGKKKG